MLFSSSILVSYTFYNNITWTEDTLYLNRFPDSAAVEAG